jgi:hypothetical protein
MAFDANKDIKIEASETSDGIFVLRSRGLAPRRRAELEIAGVPKVALNAAAGVINMIAEYTVNKAEILADQTVGNTLAVRDDGRQLLLAVRAVVSEQPAGGLWSKIIGSGKGVLRLVDVTGRRDEPPRTALATMLVHRAAVRRAKDDDDGARTELEAAIATFPGDVGAGEPPSIGGAAGTYDWQNHLAYLDLAALTADVDEAAACYERALARSDELARHEIGATIGELASFVGRPSADVEREATHIVEHNLSHPEEIAGPMPALIVIASPVWERDEDGNVARRASLMPAELASIYYGAAQAEKLLTRGPALVAQVLGREGMTAAKAAWIARSARYGWAGSKDGTMFAPFGKAHAVDGVVSSVLADMARCFRAGATDDEIALRYATGSESLDAKLAELSTWEGDQYMSAMSL